MRSFLRSCAKSPEPLGFDNRSITAARISSCVWISLRNARISSSWTATLCSKVRLSKSMLAVLRGPCRRTVNNKPVGGGENPSRFEVRLTRPRSNVSAALHAVGQRECDRDHEQRDAQRRNQHQERNREHDRRDCPAQRTVAGLRHRHADARREEMIETEPSAAAKNEREQHHREEQRQLEIAVAHVG